MNSLEAFEKFDAIKSRVIKYIMFKKRTEQEVRRKFSEIESDILEEIISNLKENGYIDDKKYVEKIIKEYEALNKLSIIQIRYKIYEKGIEMSTIDDYISSHIEELLEYELKSARSLYQKKKNTLDDDKIRQFLKAKGYKEQTIMQLED